jgi:uncharacterized protein
MKYFNGVYTISATDLAKALACQHTTKLTLERLDDRIQIIKYDDPQSKMLQEMGLDYEKDYLLQQIREGKQVATVSSTQSQEDLQIQGITVYSTIEEALAAKPDIIYQAQLKKEIEPNFILLGKIDFLELQNDGSYIVIDTKLSKITKATSVLQIAMYSELIEHYTNVKPFRMAIQKYDGNRDWFICDEYIHYYEYKKRELINAIKQYENDSRQVEPGERVYAEVPDEIEYCGMCDFKSICDSKRELDRNLRLVAGMSKADAENFREDGIDRMDDVATHSLEVIEATANRRPVRLLDKMKSLVKQASLQVQTEQNQMQSSTEVAHEYKTSEELEGLNALPEPHPDDVFLDFEKEKISVDEGLIYLTGYIHNYTYTAYWAEDYEEEKTAFYNLVNVLKEITGWTPGMEYLDTSEMDKVENNNKRFVPCKVMYSGPHIYAYSHAEQTALNKLSQKYGEKEFVSFLKKAKVIVDLRAIVTKSMFLGLRGYGLKEVEKYMFNRNRFTRNVDLLLALKSRIAIETALGNKVELYKLKYTDPITNTEISTKDIVQEYNHDDCRSLVVLRDMLNEDFTERSTIDNLSRPEWTVNEVNKNFNDPNNPRYDKDKLKLLKEVFEPKEDDDDNPLHRLLYSSLDFYDKEMRADWYKFAELEIRDPYDLRKHEGVLCYHLENPVFNDAEKIATVIYKKQDCDFVGKPFVSYGKGFSKIKGHVLSINHNYDVTNELIEVELKLDDESYSIIQREGIPDILMESESRISTDMKMRQLLGIIDEYKKIFVDGEEDFSPKFPLAHKYLHRMNTEFVPGYDPSQINDQMTASDILNEKVSNMNKSLITLQGPPGTGKSFCIKKLVAHLIKAKPDVRIAITAHGHAILHSLANSIIKELVDSNISASIVQKVSTDYRIVNGEESITAQSEDNAHVVQYSRIKDSTNEPQNDHASFPQITMGTNFFIGKEQYNQVFDYVIIEEAGQMSLVDTLVVADSGKNLIMVGDQNQLKSPIKRKDHNGAELSGLEYYVSEAIVPKEKGVFIPITRRMHPEICTFVSKMYYESRLTSYELLLDNKIESAREDALFTGSGLRHIPVEHDGRSSKSEEEVQVLKSILKELFHPDYQYDYNGSDTSKRITLKDVMIITPFNRQREAIIKMLVDLERDALMQIQNGQSIIDTLEEIRAFRKNTKINFRVRANRDKRDEYDSQFQQIVENYGEYMYSLIKPGTVDGYQGQEAPIVLYSTVCSDIEHAPRGMEFIFSPNRFNVSVSRAKALFVMIGSPKLFEVQCKKPEQMKLANAFCFYKTIAQKINVQ